MPVVQPAAPTMAVRVTAGKGSPQVLEVAPARQVRVRGEKMVIGEDAPNVFIAGTRLQALVNEPWRSVTINAVVAGSVVVRSAEGGDSYRAGDDFLLDEKWAGLGRSPISRFRKGAHLLVDYAYYLSRLDTVQVDAQGVASIRRGRGAVVCPRPAGAARGQTPLANIWVRGGMTAVTDADIFPIGPAPAFAKPDLAGTANTRKRLAAGATVRVLTLGDSVTFGYEASRPELQYPEVFAQALCARYPEARVELLRAAIPGATSDIGLKVLDRSVLKHQPHLVTIEYVNDMSFSPAKIRANYTELISRIRAIGAEVVIITPHFVWPEWMGKFDAAAAALRKLAAAKRVGLADTSARWAALQQVGIPYQTLLVNGINHPDDRGHRMFVDALMELF